MAIDRLPLVDEVRNRLKTQILTGKLRPGQRLTEQGVASEMGTSQGPVREAFSDLCGEGLLVSLPRRGTFVSTVSEEEARTAYEIRALLEPYAVAEAQPKMTAEVVRELTERIAEMHAAAKRGDFAARMAADLAFHGRIYELAGGSILARVWSILEVKIMKFAVVVAPHYYQHYGAAIEDHEQLLQLLTGRDVEALREFAVKHVTDLWRRIDAAKDGSRDVGE